MSVEILTSMPRFVKRGSLGLNKVWHWRFLKKFRFGIHGIFTLFKTSQSIVKPTKQNMPLN